MKKHLLTILVALMLTFWANDGQAQTAPPPPPNGHGQLTNQSPGGGAPIGGGLFILLGLGAAYGGKKLYDKRKESLEEE